MHALLLAAVILASSTSERVLPFFQSAKPSQPRATTVQQYSPPDRRPDNNVPQYYICPKDGAELKVPAGKAQASLKCPLDGTEMKRGAGLEKRYYLLEER